MPFLTNSLLAVLAFVLVFGIVVLVHELGHFIMARYHGVKVLEFGFGMPPRLWGYKKGDTIYSINWIPIGGFVRTEGQSDFGDSEYDAHDPKNFQNKSAWQRAQIVLAGVVMNLLLAILLLTFGYSVGMQPLIETSPGYQESLIHQGVAVREVIADGAASGSDLRVDDQITAIDSTPVDTNETLSAYTQAHPGQMVTLTVTRGEAVVSIPVTIDAATGQLGVYISNIVDIQKIRLPVHRAFAAAIGDTYEVSKMTLIGLGQMLKKIITTFSISEDIAGPVGIVSITYNVVQMGFIRVLQLAAILSITLGVLNVMPFPGLDGGHFAFIVLEKIRGKRLPGRIEARIHMIGFLLLILLIVAVTIQDVQRLITT